MSTSDRDLSGAPSGDANRHADAGGDGGMRGAVITEFGAPDVLVLRRVALPEPGPGEVRVRVDAVVVNNTRDVRTRGGQGQFSRFVTLPHILGGEHVGWVDAVGDGVDDGLVGTRVAALAAVACGDCAFCISGRDEACVKPGLIGVHRQGAYAEYAIAPAGNLLVVPEGLSSVNAAVLVTNGPVGLAQLTAAAVGEGDVLIIPGVAGALGSMVAALAARRGVRVVGVARDVERARALPLPLAAVLDAGADDLTDQLREACGPAGAQAVVDNLCVPPLWDACLGALGTAGRVVISGQIGNGPVGILPRRFYLSNQSIVGVRTGNRATASAFWREVENGFRLPEGLVATFPLEDVADVHRLVEAGGKVGHYVLTS